MKAFTVQSSDLLDKSKNPHLSLCAKDIMNNPEIPKTSIAPTIPKITVCNMTGHSGREVPNQFIITTKDASYFQSYRTIIACRTNGKVYLDKDSWDYSTTTGKYRNLFLDENKRETERKIKDGTYELANLN